MKLVESRLNMGFQSIALSSLSNGYYLVMYMETLVMLQVRSDQKFITYFDTVGRGQICDSQQWDRMGGGHEQGVRTLLVTAIKVFFFFTILQGTINKHECG